MLAIIEVLFILMLILANGVLAMAEVSILSSRRAKLRHMADRGSRRAQAALDLVNAPNEFLSTAQIGITLVGILAGVFGGATLSDNLEAVIERLPILAPYSRTIAFGIVVFFITYLSVVVGELVPKRLGMWKPEGIAAAVARPMRALSRVARPAVWALSVSTDLLLKMFRVGKVGSESGITEEEIRLLIRQGAQTGAVAPVEREIIERVFLLGDRRVSTMMTPRPDIEWIDLNKPADEIRGIIASTSHSRLPVGRGRLNEFLGVVSAHDLLTNEIRGEGMNIESCLRDPLFVPESMSGFSVLEHFRKKNTQFAVVIDEYGTITGLITLNDILQAIVGDLPTDEEPPEPGLVKREDGSWLADAMLPILELREVIPVDAFRQQDATYNTLAGFTLARLGRIPAAGDHFEVDDFRFEVLDMDGNRIDKLLITPMQRKKV